MQGNDSTYLKTITTCKHCAGYNIENYDAQSLGDRAMRQSFDAIVTKQDMADTCLPPFKAWARRPGHVQL